MTGREEMENRYRCKTVELLDKMPELTHFCNSLNMEFSSKYEYVKHIYNFLLYSKKKIEDIKYDDFIAYLNKIKNTEDGDRTTSSYQIVAYSALKKFSKYCYASEKMSKDYMANIERPKAIQSQKTITKRRKGVLSPLELTEYINNVKNDNAEKQERHIAKEWRLRNWCIIEIFLTTGIRCSALRNLDISDVDFQNKKIRVTEKGNKFREITVTEQMINDLGEWMDVRGKIMDGEDNLALFVSSHKKRISTKSVSRVVEKYARGFEGKHISPHKLRATFATTLYENTNDIMVVKETLGHSSVSTTQLYIRKTDDLTQVASNIMGSIINS